jgi:tetratricopeptide (TPR) repeat protein
LLLFAVAAVIAFLPSRFALSPSQASATSVCEASLERFTKERQTAQQLLKVGDSAGARAALLRADALCPESYNNSQDLAAAELVAGQTERAEALIQKLLLERDTAELHSLLGSAESLKKDDKAAAVQFQLAAKMEPTEQRTFDFGTSLMKVDFGAAATVLEYGVRTFPGSVKLRVGLGLALLAQDRIVEGATLLCQASELDPSDPHPMEVLADAKVVPRAVEPEVEKHLADLHRRYPADGLLLYDYAMVRSGRWSGDKGKTDPELVSGLKSALALDPHLSEASFELSQIDDQAKDYPEEIADLEKAIAVSPEVEQYHYHLAFAYRQHGDEQQFQQQLAVYQTLHAAHLAKK